MNRGFVMIIKVHEFVNHVMVMPLVMDIVRNLLRDLSVFIIVQKERETSVELTDFKRLLEVVNVYLIAEFAVDYSLSKS